METRLRLRKILPAAGLELTTARSVDQLLPTEILGLLYRKELDLPEAYSFLYLRVDFGIV